MHRSVTIERTLRLTGPAKLVFSFQPIQDGGTHYVPTVYLAGKLIAFDNADTPNDGWSNTVGDAMKLFAEQNNLPHLKGVTTGPRGPVAILERFPRRMAVA